MSDLLKLQSLWAMWSWEQSSAFIAQDQKSWKRWKNRVAALQTTNECAKGWKGQPLAAKKESIIWGNWVPKFDGVFRIQYGHGWVPYALYRECQRFTEGAFWRRSGAFQLTRWERLHAWERCREWWRPHRASHVSQSAWRQPVLTQPERPWVWQTHDWTGVPAKPGR